MKFGSYLAIAFIPVITCMESCAVRPRVYLMFGPLGSGKSSFGSCIRSQSKFIRPRRYAANSVLSYSVRRPDLINGAPLILLELPNAKLDSSSKDFAEVAQVSIRSFLLSNSLTSVHGILLFESLQEDEIKLKMSLQKIRDIFGKCTIPPILVIMIKSDIRKSIFERAQSILEICIAEGLPYMLWNNYEGIVYEPESDPVAHPLSEYQFEQQLAELDDHLTNF